MLWKPDSPIIARVLRIFLIGCGVTFLLVSTSSLSFNYFARISEERALIEQSMNRSQDSMARALWNFDTDQLQSAVNSMPQIQGVLLAEIQDARSQIIVSASKPGFAEADIEDVLSLPLLDPTQTDAIGSIQVHISTAPIRAQIMNGTIVAVFAQFLIFAALAGLLFYLLHRDVTSPLLMLMTEIERLKAEKSEQMVALQRGPHSRDEIDDLIDTINSFYAEILRERNARQSAELQSRNLSGELARMGRIATVQSLTTTIAHELNQPLGAILSNAEAIAMSMLDGRPADDPLREVITDIVDEARRAGNIIRNMRRLTEKRDITSSELALNEVVTQVTSLVRLDTRWEAVRIEVQPAASEPHVMGNAVQLQQVIINLIANARDALLHANRVDGLITISIQQNDSRHATVQVCDDGPGVPADKLCDILKPYFTTKQGGTGMGLWISQMLIEQHGGKLEFNNLATGGACFSFTLPTVTSA
ncbi:MAG: ATP-binding protein [Pseudomonadota bacterium]